MSPDSGVSAADIVVSDDAFAYLRLQKGKLEPLAHDRSVWLAAYRAHLNETYALLRAHLPETCDSILDVGSGLGGIDIMLSRHYSGRVWSVLLDGENDPPVMDLHRKTFNSWKVSDNFMRANGVRNFSFFYPEEAAAGGSDVYRPGIDLVLSLGSWCFHYPPETYLCFVLKCCHPGTVLILDVRRQKPEWAAELKSVFRLKSVLHLSEKFDRMVLHAA